MRESDWSSDVCSSDLLQACKRRGVPCVRWTLKEALETNPRRYDVISLWGVLEHVKNPLEVLCWARARLSLNGHLVICVPNVRSLVVAALREKCFTYCPQHLWYFDCHSLSLAFAQSHLRAVYLQTVESERLPCAKGLAGLDPYGPAPEWAYAPTLSDTPTDESILKSGQGYKLVAIAQAS